MEEKSMNMTGIQILMEKIVEMRFLFLLLTLLAFVLVMAVIAAISYMAACTACKGTEMTGMMRVSVTLNKWPDDTRCKDSRALHLGDFWVNMKDPVNVNIAEKDRLDRKRFWNERPLRRRYPVSQLLARFLEAYKAAGFAEDESAKLLAGLLEKDKFCATLGSCCYYNGKKGLYVLDAWESRKEANKNRTVVYQQLDIADFDTAALSAVFSAETLCDAETICVTLEYRK
jgi:hypothetical protein